MSVVLAMMGLGLSLAIEKVASGGTAPVSGIILQADFSDQSQYEGWAWW